MKYDTDIIKQGSEIGNKKRLKGVSAKIHQLVFCQNLVLGLGLGVSFTFARDNQNHNNHNHKNDNPHLNFVKETVLGDKEQGVRIRDKG